MTLFMKTINTLYPEKAVALKHISLYFLILVVCALQICCIPGKVWAQSEVYLSIRAGGSQLLGIGIGGFSAAENTVNTQFSHSINTVRQTLEDDLNQCGLFSVKSLNDSLAALSGGIFAQWKSAGAKYYLFGEVNQDKGSVAVNLIDLKTAFTILNEEYLIPSERPWYTAHVIVDDIIELFTGLRGSMASQIAYIHPYHSDANDLYVIGADGREKRQLTYSNTLNLSPSWSADGKQIAYSSLNSMTWTIQTINVDSGMLREITPWEGLNTSPAWSPDRVDFLAFTSNRDGNSEIYTSRSDGKSIRRLTNHYSIDSSPSWSPDGKQVAFTSDRTGQPMIYVMNSDGTNVHRLTSRLNAYEDSPCWSPRGDRIAFVVLFDRSFDIATASPEGGDTVILTSGQGTNENPKWSSDGMRIVFSSSRRGGRNLYIMNWDGSNVRPLTNDNISYSPAWAPSPKGNDIRISSRR